MSSGAGGGQVGFNRLHNGEESLRESERVGDPVDEESHS
jgi:hypothetical protein